MGSKWFDIKPQAIRLRQQGHSLRNVEKTLKIPKSTLSGWFKDVKLNEKQQTALRNNWLNHMYKAREKALIWHNTQKELRLKIAENQAIETFSRLDKKDKSIQELALAMLYLGEGGKTKSGTILGSSDPLILRFFIKSLLGIYDIDVKKIKCALHLRADQNPRKLIVFWSKELNIPLENFTSSSIDLRTSGRPTYSTYNGVCVVSCGNIALQRKLVYLSRKFCEAISA